MLDGGAIDEAYLTQMGQTPAVDPEKTVNEVNVPVWLIEKEMTDGVQAVADYWKGANDCTETAISTRTFPWRPRCISRTCFPMTPLSMPIPGEGTAHPGRGELHRPGAEQDLWETFLCKAQRYRSLAGNDLRPAIDLRRWALPRRSGPSTVTPVLAGVCAQSVKDEPARRCRW